MYVKNNIMGIFFLKKNKIFKNLGLEDEPLPLGDSYIHIVTICM